jgi:hypothetical protein
MSEFLTKSENEELIKRINDGDTLLSKITDTYNKVAMDFNKASSERESMKVVIRQLLGWSEEEGLEIPYEKWDEIIEKAHDNEFFFSDMLNWFVDHMNDFGENYGLEFEDSY